MGIESKRSRWWVLAAVIGVVVAGYLVLRTPVRPSSTGHQVTIGVVGPFDGPNAHIGPVIRNAVQLGFDHNPIDGLTVKVIPIDTKSDPSAAVAALQGSVSDPDLVALVAFYHSSTALAGKPVVQEAGLPALIYSASNPKVTDDAPFYFRLVPTDDNQAVVLADAARRLQARRVGILYYADEYGKGLADGFRARARDIGVEIVDTHSYDPTTVDFRSILSVMKGKAPDLVLICGFVDKTTIILNQAADQGFRAKFLAGDGTFNEQELVRGAGANAEGVYVAAPYVFDESNAKARSFLDAYWASFPGDGSQLKPASWTAFAYDAAGILARGLKEGHRTRADLHRYLRAINTPQTGYDGVAGLTYFNARGDAVRRQFQLAVVKGGRFVSAP
ncbi:MAG TPA: branched-chain amino acid ABC transporter substrate-binding protein [Gemmataceae bacterium]|nr:branched-chain amino acid ABC transporter substrate-binding protein [Gemmataceae bacterium]